MFTALGSAGTDYSQSFRPTANAIPEPATWALLIAGFGLAGAAARRQRPSITYA